MIITFLFTQLLSLRLKQIGREDLANWLSKNVLREKSAAVKRAFLGDPMKRLIARNSPLLAESPQGNEMFLLFIQQSKPVADPGFPVGGALTL